MGGHNYAARPCVSFITYLDVAIVVQAVCALLKSNAVHIVETSMLVKSSHLTFVGSRQTALRLSMLETPNVVGLVTPPSLQNVEASGGSAGGGETLMVVLSMHMHKCTCLPCSR